MSGGINESEDESEGRRNDLRDEGRLGWRDEGRMKGKWRVKGECEGLVEDVRGKKESEVRGRNCREGRGMGGGERQKTCPFSHWSPFWCPWVHSAPLLGSLLIILAPFWVPWASFWHPWAPPK